MMDNVNNKIMTTRLFPMHISMVNIVLIRSKEDYFVPIEEGVIPVNSTYSFIRVWFAINSFVVKRTCYNTRRDESPKDDKAGASTEVK